MKENRMKASLLLGSILKKGSYLDCNNISWKWVGDNFIGKRTVFTHDLRAVWLEQVDESEIKSWWCGRYADYDEVFTCE